MKILRTLFLVVSFFVLSSEAKAQWTQLPETFGGNSVISMKAMNNELYAGTMGGAGGRTYKSVDDGITWTVCNTGLDSSYVINFATIDTVIFAGTGHVYNNTSAVFRSVDHGATWVNVLGNLGSEFKVATKDSTVFAICSQGMVYRSSDFGANWTTVYTFQPGNYICLATDSVHVYFLSGNVFMSSTDNGTTWSPGTIPFPGIYQSIHTKGPYVYAIFGSYVWRSADNGVTWVSLRGNLTYFIYHGEPIFVGNNLYMPSNDGVFTTPYNDSTWSCVGLDDRLNERTTCLETLHNYMFAGGGHMFRTNTAQLVHTGVGIATLAQAEEVKIYPNPSNGVITLDGDELFSALVVVNVLGETVYRESVAGKKQFDLSFLPAAVYSLKLEKSNGSTVWARIVID